MPCPKDARHASDVAYTYDSLRRIWLSALEREDADDSLTFFDNGGDSLATMAVITAIKDEYGVALTLEEFFDYATLPELTRLVNERRRRDP